MQHIKGIVVLLAGAAAMMAAAYLPPVAERDGVTVRIVGFDETKDREDIYVVTREADKPFPVEITVSNKGAAAVSGEFKVWMNDDWDILDVPAGDLAVPVGVTRSLKMMARAKASRVLAAHYPIHVTYAVPGGEPLHPIAIFKVVLPIKAATAETVAATRLAKGVTRLVQVPATTWTEVKGKVAPLPGGPTGAKFGISVHAAEGVSKNGFLCHPPWKTGAGVEWRDIPLELPAGHSIRFRFALALGRHFATEPPSDGTEHKVFVVDEGNVAKEVFSRVVTSFAWEEECVDLSPWAGQAITLRLWTGPGPKMNTTCDRCAWGEPVILVGERPMPPTETEWTEREAAAVEAAQAAIVFGTDAAKGRFRLDVRGERWGAACAFGKMGVLDGVLAFTDGTHTLTYRGFACDVDETTVGAGLLDMPCTRVEAHAEGSDALEILHLVEMGDCSVMARVRLWAEKGALRMRWDMPGAVRDERGNPRYTRLGLGTGALPAARAYAGFGNVIETPRSFLLEAGGVSLSARHVGADYANGMSLVQAVDVFPDRLVCNRSQNRYAIETHHDATFAFIPSAKGAFAAARAFRDICGYRKSPSWKEAATRMCIDQWGGDYAMAAEGLALAGKYGLNESFFVKHVWQRWGYDYRLPEIFPPLGSNEDFLKMRAAAKDASILFCPHDNYIDFYPDAADYSYDHIVFNRDGTPQRAWYNKGRRAQSYRWAPHAFLPWLKANAATLRDAFAPDAIFIDVFTSMPPMDYYDRAGRFYPKTRTQEEWGRAFDTYRALIGSPYGVMVSEGGTDALVGHLDAGQSDHFGAERWMNPTEFDDAERTPWHDMASHGSFVLLAGGLGPRYSAPAWNKNGNERLHGYGSDDYLCNTVIGGRTPMCGGPCNRSTVMTYWLLHDVCKSLALAEFESLDYGANIHQQHSAFSNGGEVWINRATNGVPWTVKGYELPSYGFYATVPGARAGIVRIGGQRCAFAETAGSVFVDARPPETGSCLQIRGVKTDGAFRLEHPATGDWRIIPLPRSHSFRATLDLDTLGAPGVTVVAVEAIDAEPDAALVDWKQQGTTLGLVVDARAFGYRIRFAAK
jgi:hypothetical protein